MSLRAETSSDALITDLFRTNNTHPIDAEFECAANASGLSSMLCRLMCVGFDILHDIHGVFRRMQRLGVRVHYEVLENLSQLVAVNDDADDMRNQKFLVVMADGSKYVLTFQLVHNY